MLFQVPAEAFADHRIHHATDLCVAQLGLGLALELGIGQLDADHRRQPLTNILSGQVGLVVLDEVVLAGVVVNHPGKGRAESGQVAAPLLGVDAIGKGNYRFSETVVILDRDLHRSFIHRFLEIEGRLLEHSTAFVHVPNQVGNTTVKIVGALDITPALVLVPVADKPDFQTLVQVGDLLEVVRQNVIIVLNVREDLRIRLERDNRPVVGGSLAFDDFAGRDPLGIFLVMDVAISMNLGLQVGRQAIHHGSSDAMKTTGYLVGAAAELAASVQRSHDCLQS